MVEVAGADCKQLPPPLHPESGWKRDREYVRNMSCVSALQWEVKMRVLAGETFYAGSGTIKKDLLKGR